MTARDVQALCEKALVHHRALRHGEGRPLLAEASRRGHPEAAYGYAVCLARGLGGPVDKAAAG
ncbi:hypothetical protein [Amphiplicatus metriothermophilus]|uniref:Uncharacterized protein n=1 Tax=Amphiplicatus metriothermophilus TaxID=1519374 RepID=A0A239PZE3_9PROT|nr:hypothetical protein [Amphiplicatus metriothermophilus]MBB5518239.1 TPR repeat protein [Amphiplicatus metriothermophilus]SNT75448.1 hypothetical protein SAMN06297382_2744 [Amphiplicatus metriothermophilus]